MMRKLLIPLAASALLAAGAVAPAQAAPQATGDVQLVTPYDVSQMRHTIRHTDGTWQPWDITSNGVDDCLGLVSVMVNGVDHVFYSATATHQPSQYEWHHTGYDANGYRIGGTMPAGIRYGVKVANLNGRLALVSETADNVLSLSQLQSDGASWSAWETVPTTGSIGTYAVTANGGVLRVLVTSADGTQIGDYDRAADGTWSQPNWVPYNGGVASELAVAQVGADLQVAALSHSGNQDSIWHSIRHANGTWDQFGYVEGVAGDLPGIWDIAVTSSRGELQLATATNDGVYHTIRHANGTWQHFGDVTGVLGGPRYGGGITIAGE